MWAIMSAFTFSPPEYSLPLQAVQKASFPQPNAGERPAPPVIYTASYSNIPVYEMMCNSIAVMRRRSDGYMNATQILKVAGIDKGRRTKILEKEIHSGEHEKIQGGYGKYQGTWINFARSKEFCQQYGVDDILSPILELEPSDSTSIQTPTKEQVLAAHRKEAHHTSSELKNSMNSAQVAIGALTAFSHALDDESHYFEKEGISPPELPAQEFSEPTDSASQKLDTDVASEPKSNNNVRDTNFWRDSQASKAEHEPYVFDRTNGHKIEPLPPIEFDDSPLQNRSREVLTSIFINNDNSEVLTILQQENEIDVDVPIDELGHTALHWAAALARIPLVETLIKRGADPLRVNYAGESALVRAVLVTNNLDQSSFSQLLNLLYPAITLKDKQHRTVLHHIGLAAGIKGRSAASRYYLETLLEWVVRRGTSVSQPLSLNYFISDCVGAQDRNGDTALNIASRIGNKSIVQQLLDVGANTSLANKAGLRPIDFGVGHDPSLPPPLQVDKASLDGNKSKEKSQDIITGRFAEYSGLMIAMSAMLGALDDDFKEEIRHKQAKVEIEHASLRQATLQLAQKRRKLDSLKRMTNDVSESRQRSYNLDRAITEEEDRFKKNMGNMGNGMFTSIYQGQIDADAPFLVANSYSSWGSTQQGSPKRGPPVPILKARLEAYQLNSAQLRDLCGDLRGRSYELEEKYRHVVSLCTGVEVDRVDSLLENLVQAVESDPVDVDLGKVRGILQQSTEKR